MPKPYANPYVAGTGLGLVLLAAFVVAGRGLGASGAFARTATAVVAAVAPERAHASAYFSSYADDGPWLDWIVVEIIGVAAGGFLSARVARRWRVEIERGPGHSTTSRLVTAGAGGVLMGAGAVFARGCTSGLALTGGALLSVGAWIFIGAAFATAYAITPLIKRGWQ